MSPPPEDTQQDPLPRPRRFVTREEFAAASRTAPPVDLERFRRDQEVTLNQDPSDPYTR